MRKWKCVKVDSSKHEANERRWTVGNTYETDNNGDGLVSDDLDNGFIEPFDFHIDIQGVEFEEVKQFTKADLKPCMVVELRNKGLAIISNIETELALSYEDGEWDTLSIIGNDFNYIGQFSNKDVLKVYGFADSGRIDKMFDVRSRPLLWERIEKSPTQLKLEERENKQREIADEIKKVRGEME